MMITISYKSCDTAPPTEDGPKLPFLGLMVTEWPLLDLMSHIEALHHRARRFHAIKYHVLIDGTHISGMK